MPTIHEPSAGLRTCIYADDHAPPHFHLKRPGFECQVRLSDLTVMQGRIDRRDLALATAWAANNIEPLRRIWSDLDERG